MMAAQSLKPVLIIAGSTGSGKSALALNAAEEFGGTVINADSMQIYRELRVLTARPSPQDEARVAHCLFGVLPASERCSVGRWLAMATAEIQATWERKSLPIVVGGTGLYVKALMEGLAPVPDIPEQVRAEARARMERLGGAAFREELSELDPAAAHLAARDRQRLVRAYEVVKATGRPLTAWQSEPAAANGLGARFTTLVLLPPRDALYAALDARFEAMMAAGAVDEVRRLLALDLDPALPAMKAVGVRELASYVRGERALEQAIADAKRATRNYAKRQGTWLRHQVTGAICLDRQYSESLKRNIFAIIRRMLLTREK
jgi:tRNA dimethylallyltransferase